MKAPVLPDGLPSWFKKLDHDPADGQVGMYECSREQLKEIDFAKYDRNKDGFITAAEALYGTAPKVAATTEKPAGPATASATTTATKPAATSSSSSSPSSSSVPIVISAPASTSTSTFSIFGGRSSDGSSDRPDTASSWWKQYDHNKDGKLSKEEVAKSLYFNSERFSKLDANSDGFLDTDEISKGPQDSTRRSLRR